MAEYLLILGAMRFILFLLIKDLPRLKKIVLY